MHLYEFLNGLTNNSSQRQCNEAILSLLFFDVREVNNALVNMSIELTKRSGRFLIKFIRLLHAFILISIKGSNKNTLNN